MLNSKRDTAKTTITVWDWKGPANPQIQQWFDWIKETFEERNPDIEIDYQLGVQDYLDKFVTAHIGGVSPDVFYASVAWARDLFNQGYLMDLSDYIARSDVVSPSGFIPVTQVYSTKDVQTYGIPFKLDAAALVYNKQHFLEAGIDIDPEAFETWDDLISAAKKLTRVQDGEIVRSGLAPSDSLEAFTAWLYSNGGTFYNEDLTASSFNNEVGQQTLAFIVGQFNEFDIYSRVAGDFNRETASMRYWGTFAPPYIRAANAGLDFGITNFPSGPSGTGRSTATWANMFTIPTHSRYPDQAWKYIEFVTSLESQLKLLEFAGEPGAPTFQFYQSELFREKALVNDWMTFIPDIYQSGGPYPFLNFSNVNREVAPIIRQAVNQEIPITEAISRMSQAVDRLMREYVND